VSRTQAGLRLAEWPPVVTAQRLRAHCRCAFRIWCRILVHQPTDFHSCDKIQPSLSPGSAPIGSGELRSILTERHVPAKDFECILIGKSGVFEAAGEARRPPSCDS
jgi:hypothetical protein